MTRARGNRFRIGRDSKEAFQVAPCESAEFVGMRYYVILNVDDAIADALMRPKR